MWNKYLIQIDKTFRSDVIFCLYVGTSSIMHLGSKFIFYSEGFQSVWCSLSSDWQLLIKHGLNHLSSMVKHLSSKYKYGIKYLTSKYQLGTKHLTSMYSEFWVFYELVINLLFEKVKYIDKYDLDIQGAISLIKHLFQGYSPNVHDVPNVFLIQKGFNY